MVNSDFILLCSKAWAIQILAYMHNQNDARVSPIAHQLAASRTSVSAAIQHLIMLGLLQKNSGHGHPLRPAFALTKKGKQVAAWAAELDSYLAPNDWTIARRNWSLPVLRQAIPASRFGKLRAELSPVTDRALSETLKTLGEHHWLDRRVDVDLSPPSVTYFPQGIGEIIVPVLTESICL